MAKAKGPPFGAIHRHGFVRVAAMSPRASAGDIAFNIDETIKLAGEADARGVDLAVFPELNLSSYAVDDLHLQDAFLDQVEAGIARLASESAGLSDVTPLTPLSTLVICVTSPVATTTRNTLLTPLGSAMK